MAQALSRPLALAALSAALLAALPAAAQERTIKIYGFGAKSGVVRIFGLNSEAAMKAAAEQINKAGGVTLGDGAKAKIVIEYLDDRCNAEEGINALRRIAAQPDAIVAVGPTCSNVAEPVFGILQKKVGDAGDSGLQFPLYTDVAAKGGLASISQWAFRNVPSEAAMYRSLFDWNRTTHPDGKTFWGGVDSERAHRRPARRVSEPGGAVPGKLVGRLERVNEHQRPAAASHRKRCRVRSALRSLSRRAALAAARARSPACRRTDRSGCAPA